MTFYVPYFEIQYKPCHLKNENAKLEIQKSFGGSTHAVSAYTVNRSEWLSYGVSYYLDISRQL